MISNIDILLDSSSFGIIPGGSLPDGDFPPLTRSDTYNVRLLIKELTQSNSYIDSDMTGGSFKFAIGGIDEAPESGQFKLVVNGTTSSAITYTSTATALAQSIYSAISNNVSTVNPFGLDEGAFICVATATNTALTISGDVFTLYPSSSIITGNRVDPTTNSQAQKVLKIRRNPAVYADNFVDVIDGTAIDLVKITDGNILSYQNETYRIDVGTSVLGGSFVLNYGGNSTTAIPIFSSSIAVADALNSIAGLDGNIDVSSNNNGGYSISFVRGLGLTNIATPLAIDTSGVFLRKYKQATVTLSTVELDELFADSGSNLITTIAEIQYLDEGSPKTLFQGDVAIRRDLILDNTSLPVNTASYYTKAQADTLFVEDAITGAAGTINASNFSLHSSDGKKSVDWNQRKLFDGSVEYLRWDDGIGFFGNAAISKPSGNNLINSITRTGLLSYTAPTGSNLINALTQTGLIQYTAPSGTSLVNCLTSSGIINYTVPTTSNLAAAITATGILNYVAPTGSNLINAITATGLITYTAPTGNFLNQLTKSGIVSGYNVPSTSNFINALTQTGLFNYNPVTPRNSLIKCLQDFGTINVTTYTEGFNENILVSSQQIGIFPRTIGANTVSFTLNIETAGIVDSAEQISGNTSTEVILPLIYSPEVFIPSQGGGEVSIGVAPTNIPGVTNIGTSLNFGDILEVYARPSKPGIIWNVNVVTFLYVSVVTATNAYGYFQARGARLVCHNITENTITLPPIMDFKLLHIAF